MISMRNQKTEIHTEVIRFVGTRGGGAWGIGERGSRGVNCYHKIITRDVTYNLMTVVTSVV